MNRFLVAHTPQGSNLWASQLKGHEALSQLYQFTVDFKSQDANIDCQALIGEVAAIEMEAQNGIRRYFSGQIVRFAALGKRGKYWTYQAILAPKLWHAGRRSDFKIWQNTTVQDIADDILGKNAIRYEWRIKQGLKNWEYKVQYGETDLDFLTRLLEHEGLYYWFEHSPGGETLILADHFTTPEPFGGYESIPFYPPDEAREDEDHYWDWEMARAPEPGKLSHSDYDFKKPSSDLTTESSDPRGHLFDQYEIYQYPGNYIETGDGDQYANARLEALQAQQDRIILRGKVRGAIPGYRFDLWRHPRADQNRGLLIVSATYDAQDNDYEGRGDSQGVHFFIAIEAQPADRGYRPLTRTQAPRARGPETAVVVGPEGEEIHTDEYGRVKVHFHWDRYGKKDGTDSCWIRVASPWAGSNFGAIQIPRIGQEVIVDYEYGDPDRPLITGRVYNAEQMPPWGLPANKTQSGFLTRSTHGGAAGDGLRDGVGDANAIRFEDAKGQEQLWLHAQKDQLTEVENDESKWVGNDRRKEIDRDEFNTIHRDRTEVVDRNEKITVHGWRTEEVDQDETITIHQNRKERVDLSEKISIGINRTESVGLNEKVTIGVNQNLKVGANKQELIGLTSLKTVGMMQMTNIGGAYNLNVGAAWMTNVGFVNIENIGKMKKVTVGESTTMHSGKSTTITAGETITISAPKNIVLQSGGTKIVLDGENNTISIEANKVLIDGTTIVDVDSKKIDLN
ncbi:type VI secretion system Vgr family protein [Lampropedia aestuarii]|uniref:type VI secretion system Vgr family protein n=2 Tax=Lampropedia aestuarii TaxID=2562762 RepID=UPI002468FCF4|nr:type VI secretion system tip protein TssI/VgrG [Lampropedia aestuarii]MDH5858725.1 type VI secretion system tip protein TssI/VgrG [Lampropedia aestuarii]